MSSKFIELVNDDLTITRIGFSAPDQKRGKKAKDSKRPTTKPCRARPDKDCIKTKPFNGKGLSLAQVDDKLELAIRTMIPLYDQIRPLIATCTDGTEQLPSPDWHRVFTLRSIAEADDAAIRKNDKDLADQIRKDSFNLLQNPLLQSAVARWCYAAWYGSTPKTRQLGEKLLMRAKSSKGGPKLKHKCDNRLLLEAYKAMTEYGEELGRCWKATKSVADVQKNFSDCDKLRVAGLVLEPVHLRRYGMPSVSDLAEQYIQHRTGIGPTLLHEHIDDLM